MCNAEDDLEKAKKEISDLEKQLREYRGVDESDNTATPAVSIPITEINKIKHSEDCFNKYAGCICVKRYVDYLATPKIDPYIPLNRWE